MVAAPDSEPLPPDHGLPAQRWPDADSALAHLADLRLRAVAAVLLLARPDLNLPAVVMEVSRRNPDVPVVVASFDGASHTTAGRAVVRPAGSEALLAAIRQALRSAVQQARVRTTLDRLNYRLRTQAVERDAEQQRLFLSGLYLSSFIEQAQDAMFVTDRRGTVALWNSAAGRLFACSHDQMVGRSVEDCGGGTGAALGGMIAALSPGDPKVARSLSVSHGPETRHLDVTLGLVHSPDGEAIAVSGIARDVTERVVLLRELEQRAAALEESSRLKDEFLAVLSHELRTPLNVILGWTRILLERPGDEARVQRVAETIQRNAQLQQRLVEDLLDYARIAAGRLALQRDVHDVAAVVRSALEAHRPAIDARGLHLIESYEDGVHAELDAERWRQVVGNLVGNAVKFTAAAGQIRVTVTGRPHTVTMEVADTGRGIAPEFLPHVFEHFRQEKTTSTPGEGGLGLGLAITRRIVELHGGTIEAHSAGVGRGAAFRATLPRINRRKVPAESSFSAAPGC